MSEVNVIGAGAWGTAIANLLASNGHIVTIYARESHVVQSINDTHMNNDFLPDFFLHKKIKAVGDLLALNDSIPTFLAIPAQFFNITLQTLKEGKGGWKGEFVICSKGIENNSLKLLSDIVLESFPKNEVLILSGPNFAIEVANSTDAITTIAGNSVDVSEKIIKLLENDKFHPYFCNDIVGAQVSGAMKNIIAIALGILRGMKASESMKAAFITKGLNEIADISQALGGKRETMLHPCAIGDLILTCSSLKSRNMSLGYKLGQGEDLQSILSKRITVAEGVASAKSIYQISKKHNLSPNISLKIYEILHNKKDVYSLLP